MILAGPNKLHIVMRFFRTILKARSISEAQLFFQC